MLKNFIVATDLSKDSYVLVCCVGGLKVFGAERCLLLQFRSVDDVVEFSRACATETFSKYDHILEEQKKTLEKQGYTVETRVLSGFPANEINKIAVEEDYSVIVVGARRSSSTGEVFFSSLANDLIHIAEKPVLLSRSKKQGAAGLLCCSETLGCEVGNHVLYPTDFSENADLAFTSLLDMAADRARKITLLHVQDKTRISPYLENRIEEFNKIDRARLEGMKKMIQEKGKAEVDIVIKYGNPSVEILDTAKELDVDMVVMGSQGRGFVKEFFLGSVSYNTARFSPSSVLLIPTNR
ncbi:MAG: universal stress protein [Synergistaceae bacterium]|nr:universal stress protein [Synergistaceae bacterium]